MNQDERNYAAARQNLADRDLTPRVCVDVGMSGRLRTLWGYRLEGGRVEDAYDKIRLDLIQTLVRDVIGPREGFPNDPWYYEISPDGGATWYATSEIEKPRAGV
jgi:hypothetical protein